MFKQQRQQPSRVGPYALIAIVVLLIGLWLGGHPSWLPGPIRSVFVSEGQGRKVDDVLSLLAKNYYKPVNVKALVDKGLEGAVASLNDPYSHYFSRTDYQSFLQETNPHLSGIGIDVLPNARGLEIVGVFPNSPAAKAGLRHGELITAVGSTSLAGKTSDFASRLIKGRAGTSVTLTLLVGVHRRVVSITRANVVVPVASSKLLTYKGVKLGDVQLTSFTDGSGDELRVQVDKMLHSGAKGLILDLRDNGGGLLNEAVKVASVFVPDGTIVSTQGRAQPRQVYLATGGAISSSIPVVVLVDRGTASSAEIVTGALQDRGRAKVVGTHTYGKGVFQEIQTVPGGGALDITVGEYFTPSGHNLGGGGVREGAGIKPNIYAYSKPQAAGDHALRIAERVLAAEVP